eukprot:scaffold733_cov267-Pinguiococcus_pyrenoidosus.AAC.32
METGCKRQHLRRRVLGSLGIGASGLLCVAPVGAAMRQRQERLDPMQHARSLGIGAAKDAAVACGTCERGPDASSARWDWLEN